MSIIIGAARQDENEYIGGGNPGDQTGHEVETYPWTDRQGDGWYILRLKDPAKRKKAVKMLLDIVANPNIGYSQWTHGQLEKAGKEVNWDFSKIPKRVDTDCCDLQRTIAIALGIMVKSCYTANQVKVFMNTGEYELLTGSKYAHTDSYLLAGDVGCMPYNVQGHTWMSTEDGPFATTPTETTYIVICNALCLREYPDKESRVLHYLRKNDTFETVSFTTDESGTVWAQGVHDGIVGYASMKYLTPAVKLPLLYTVKASWLRSSADASKKDNKIVVIPKDIQFAGTGARTKAPDGREWFEAMYNGLRGWVSSRYLKVS